MTDFAAYVEYCVTEYGADAVAVPPARLDAMLASFASPSPGRDAIPPAGKPDKKLAAMLVGDAALSTVVEFRRKGVVVGRAVIA